MVSAQDRTEAFPMADMPAKFRCDHPILETESLLATATYTSLGSEQVQRDEVHILGEESVEESQVSRCDMSSCRHVSLDEFDVLFA